MSYFYFRIRPESTFPLLNNEKNHQSPTYSRMLPLGGNKKSTNP